MKNIKTLVAAAIIGLSLLNFTTFNKNNEEPKQKVSSSKGYEVGDTAADFKLKNIDGKMVSLSDFKMAKGFIVVFTCNHCPYAKKYEDRIVALDKKYKEAGYPVIAINPNDPNVQPEDGFQQMITRAKEKGFTFPYLVDEGQKVYPQYGATKTPHVFILQKEGAKNIVKYIGAIDNNYDDPNDVSERYVEDAMDALLSGKPVANAKTVAIGCTIKVKK
ncbi:Thiol-disulfide oxidoreductase ResA [Chryseobacterium sp. MOF25P]|uniref:thioredoxin family protein n=1 Tax=unclassified Chryseobacterium TaxID=2593645 RepID=UPI0008049D9C|nr:MULTISPECIES: thioredoxin family protein [unclassified Chryseobacterium]OBW42284.1 Thiol-disulfide oxidoreductase ResA [Chryseobacterium sp. MOF25P]OBW46803.1 Thiol-disulfide oxidoreductase ResA [Chryseobacterium sp. BGARF1]